MGMNSGILEDLGTYGWHHLEEAIFTLLITGDAGLLLGSKGSNKTNGLRSISRLVLPDDVDWKTKFHAYSAPNDEFEDLIGIPDPSGMREGVMRYIVSDVSIWDKVFVLIDEVNRANPQLQGKYLQLLLSREILGKRTKVVWMWGAMNPLSYIGTNPLDPAMADRFAMMLRVPELYELSEEHQKLAIGNQGVDSLFALSYWKPELRDAIVQNASYSEQRVKRARHRFQELRKELTGVNEETGLLREVERNYGTAIQQFLSNSTTMMAASYAKDIPDERQRYSKLEQLISGRRASMMWRSFITRIAIRNVLAGQAPRKDELQQIMEETFLSSLTTKSTGSEFDTDCFAASFVSSVSVVTSVGSLWDNRIELERNPVKQLAMTLLYKRINANNVDIESKLESLLSIPASDDYGDNRDITNLKTTHEKGLMATGVMETFVRPALCALYISPLVEVNNTTLGFTVRAKIAGKVNRIIRWFHTLTLGDDSWPLISRKVADAYFLWCAKLLKKAEDEADPYYKISHLLFVYASRSLIVNDVKLMQEEDRWAQELNTLGEAILNMHTEIKKHLGPIVRQLFFESYLPTGMNAEQHATEMKLAERRFRNLPDNEPTEESREDKEARLMRELLEVNPELAGRFASRKTITEVEEVHLTQTDSQIMGATSSAEVEGPEVVGTVELIDSDSAPDTIDFSEADDNEDEDQLEVLSPDKISIQDEEGVMNMTPVINSTSTTDTIDTTGTIDTTVQTDLTGLIDPFKGEDGGNDDDDDDGDYPEEDENNDESNTELNEEIDGTVEVSGSLDSFLANNSSFDFKEEGSSESSESSEAVVQDKDEAKLLSKIDTFDASSMGIEDIDDDFIDSLFEEKLPA